LFGAETLSARQQPLNTTLGVVGPQVVVRYPIALPTSSLYDRCMGTSWSERAAKADGLPNLGLGGTLVAACSTSYFAAKVAGVLTVIIIRGWNAYFVAGLRVADWKHGVMSDGRTLPFPGMLLLGLISFVLWLFLIGCVEFVAGHVQAFLKPDGPWARAAARLVGAPLLLSLALWFYRTGKFPLIHPVPFAPLIGGIVLLWKGIVGACRAFRQRNNVQ
jgi:peptidoglycan/LPS O-acetylase OafA/YrhL